MDIEQYTPKSEYNGQAGESLVQDLQTSDVAGVTAEISSLVSERLEIGEPKLNEISTLTGIEFDSKAEPIHIPNSVGADGWVARGSDEQHLVALAPKSVDTYKERFRATAQSNFRVILGSTYTENDEFTINVLPSATLLNETSTALNESGPRFRFVDCNDSNISGETYVTYLANGEIPLATNDLNYIIHDRALDDHVPGWLIIPPFMTECIQSAAQNVKQGLSSLDSNVRAVFAEKAKTMTAAFDFLTYSLTMYSWLAFNGTEVAPPPASIVFEHDRFAFKNIDMSLRQITEAGGTEIPEEFSELIKAQGLIDDQINHVNMVSSRPLASHQTTEP